MSIGTLGLQDIVLDISTKLKQKTFRANESDTNARGLSATIKNNGAIYDCTGVTLRFRYIDPITLQAHIFDFEPVSALLGTFKIAFPSEMIRGNGGKTIKCTIVAEDSTSELAFENIYVFVNMSEVDSNGIEASNEYSTLRKALDDVQAVETGLGNINPTTLANAVTLASTISVAESDRNTNEGTRNINENTRTVSEVAREVAEANRNVYEAYNVLKAYKLNNKVTYLGSSYLCIQATTKGIAPTDVAYWLKIVSKGDQGVQGVQGIKGDKGDTGAKGDTGSQGVQGIKGDTGDKGEKGDTGLKGDRGETFAYTHMTPTDKQDLISNATGQWNPDFETKYTALETEYATDLTGVKSQLAETMNKTAVTLSNQFADNAARDAYFTANPTKLVDKLFIKVGAAYQQRLDGAWSASSPVLAVVVTAANQPFTPTGGIAASNTQAAIVELDTEKANKAQEAWIAPTLLNSATAYAGSTPGYFKDQFGVVRLRGKIIVANDTFAITLPAGYRPPETISFVIAMLNNTVFARCQVDLNGGLKVYGTMSTYFDLGSIQFKAV